MNQEVDRYAVVSHRSLRALSVIPFLERSPFLLPFLLKQRL